MAESLTDRITAAHKAAIGRMERATYQGEHDEWKRIIRLLEDVRDELNKRPVAGLDVARNETERKTLTLPKVA